MVGKQFCEGKNEKRGRKKGGRGHGSYYYDTMIGSKVLAQSQGGVGIGGNGGIER